MAGALALAAVFLIAIVEMVFSPAGKGGCAMPHQMMEESVAKPKGVASSEAGVFNPRDAESRRKISISSFSLQIETRQIVDSDM